MTRNEAIVNQAMRYAEQSALVHDIPERIVSLVKEAFVVGTMWADNNPYLFPLWHYASEEPERPFNILVVDEFSHSWTLESAQLEMLHENWDVFVVASRLIMWANIYDLLPAESKTKILRKAVKG